MANQRNFVIFDLETSGLHPEEGAEIVQLAASVINSWDFKPHSCGKIELIFKPQTPETAQPGAIKVIGEDLWNRALTTGIDPKVGLETFFKLIDDANQLGKAFSKPILVGHNINFDMRFITHYAAKHKVLTTEPPWFTTMDTMTQMLALFESDPAVTRFTLDNSASVMGLARATKNHDAVEDVALTEQIFIRQMEFFRKCRQKMKINPGA